MNSTPSQAADLKLVFISTAFWPKHGGAEKRFLGYFRGFLERGISVTVLSGTPKESKVHVIGDQTFTGNRFVNREDGIEYVYYRLPGRGGEAREKALFENVRDYLKNAPDVKVLQLLGVHTQHAVSFIREMQDSGRKIVYAYALSQKPVLKLDRTRILRKFVKYFRIRKILELCDFAVIQSSELKEELNLKDGGHVKIIPNGVDFDRFRRADRVERNRARESLGLDSQKPIILTVGTISPRKQTGLIVDAWLEVLQTYDSIKLLVVGPELNKNTRSYRAYVDNIHKKISESGRMEDISMVGYTENILDYYTAADIFVYAPVKEGMPNALLEAMASGLPCVLTKFTGLSRDFGEVSRHYLLAERTTKAISEKLIELVESVELREYIAGNARTLMEQTMGMEGIIDQYCDLYRNLATVDPG